jgi:hypothetical protein
MKLTVLTLTLTALFPLAARAGDVKSYPGYACLTHETTVVRSGSAMINTDTASHAVACPAARELISRDVKKVVVVVIDQSPTANVSCILSMKTPEGVETDSQTLTSTGSGSSTQTLTFGPLTSTDQGHLQLYCTLPGTNGGLPSSVVSYRVNEDTP